MKSSSSHLTRQLWDPPSAWSVLECLLLQVLMGRKMEDWLRFSVCYWHSFCGTGTAAQLFPPTCTVTPRLSHRVGTSVFPRRRSFRVPDALPSLEWRSAHGSSQEAAESCVWVLHQTGSEMNHHLDTVKIKPTWESQISESMSVYCASTGEILHIPRQVSHQICLRTLSIINLCFSIIDIFFPRDVAPEGSSLEESNRNLDEITDLALQLQTQTGVEVLWVTCNLFAHPRWCLPERAWNEDAVWFLQY